MVKLVSQQGVQLGFSNQGYGQSPNLSSAINFSPAIVNLQPGLAVNVTVKVHALEPGSEPRQIAISAVTLEGTTVGIGPIHTIFFDVNVIG